MERQAQGKAVLGQEGDRVQQRAGEEVPPPPTPESEVFSQEGARVPHKSVPPKKYLIVGTWDDWKAQHQMHWDADMKGFFFDIELGSNPLGLAEESFQFLLNGDWRKSVHPNRADACPQVPYWLCGPDGDGHGCNWTIGKHRLSKGVKGSIHRVVLLLNDQALPQKVSWVEHGTLPPPGELGEATPGELQVEPGPPYEEALVLRLLVAPAYLKPQRFCVEMVLDHNPSRKGRRRPAKGAVVKQVDSDTDVVIIKNMPSGRNFLVSAIARFRSGAEVRSQWVPALTLPYTKPSGTEFRDIQGSFRGKCLFCHCKRFRRRREKEEQSSREIFASICRGCGCPASEHSTDDSDFLEEIEAAMALLPQAATYPAPNPNGGVKAPLVTGPPIHALNPQKFGIQDQEGWLQHLAEEGFVVISDILAADEVSRAMVHLWDFLQACDAAGKVRREDVSTWNDSQGLDAGWPADKANGVINSRGIGQSELLWYLRSHRHIKQMYSSIWGTNHLITSFDGAGVFRPYGKHPDWRTDPNWYHIDQGHEKTGLHCIQGSVSLTDSDSRTGGFIVVPRSHRFHSDVLRKSGPGGDFVRLNDNDPILTESECGGPRLLSLRAGDAVLWDSRTIHCNTPAIQRDAELLTRQELLRAVAYVCMTPGAWCTDDAFAGRAQAVPQRVTTKHWPHEYQVVDRPGESGLEHPRHACSKSISSFTREQLQLVKPDVRMPGNFHSGALSLLPMQRFRVCRDVVPVRSSATMEWGEIIGHLKKGSRVKGHVFGNWILLALESTPPGMGDDFEQAWVCYVAEDEQGRALAPEND